MSTSIRKKMIHAFAQSPGTFLSGQALADLIGCSRTAIWKQIEELRKSGYEIEAIRKKGYRLVSMPDQLSENEILLGLQTKKMGHQIIYLDTTESTQTIAHKAAVEGAIEGTLVIAEEQTGGKGRMAREWHSSKQNGIWMSLIIRPSLSPEKAPQFTLITAIAVAQAIEVVTGLEPEIKWPNDILLNGKKVTGILTELQGDADKINYLVIGIGVNVNQATDDFPPSIQEIATSLAIETGKEITRSLLVQTIMAYFEKYYALYMEKGFAPLKILWETYAISIGKSITATTFTGKISGRAIGITEDGVLKVEDEKGKIHYIYSADITVHS